MGTKLHSVEADFFEIWYMSADLIGRLPGTLAYVDTITIVEFNQAIMMSMDVILTSMTSTRALIWVVKSKYC